LHDEVIYVLQTVQNIIDQGDTSFNGEPADTRYGYDDVIALSGTNFNYTFSRNTTDETLELVIEDTITTTTKTFVLTNEHRVKIKEFYIKRVPFKSQSVYRNQMHEGFWLFMDVEIPAYSADKRWFRIDRNVQTFFNIRKYD
jgi:hypothetical protein